MTTLNKLYSYIYTVDLVYMDDTMTAIREDNVPMNNLRPLKVFKGVDNTIRFRVFNPDRKPIDVGTGECDWLAKIFDSQTNEHILDRYLTYDATTELIDISVSVDPTGGSLPTGVRTGTYTGDLTSTDHASNNGHCPIIPHRPACVEIVVGNCRITSITLIDFGNYEGGAPNVDDITADIISIIINGNPNLNPGDITPDDLGVTIDTTTQSEASQGFLNLTLREADLINFLPCYYNISIVCEDTTNNNNIRRPLYTDLADNVCQNLLVVDCVYPEARPTQVVNSFLEAPQDVWTSSIVSGGRRWNTLSSLHSIAIYTTDFTGLVRVQATLDDDVSSNDWFDVDLTTLDNFVQFNNESGIHFATFYANVRMLRFIYEPDTTNTGTVDQILLRN